MTAAEPVNLDDAKASLRAFFGETRDADGVPCASMESPWGRAVAAVADEAVAWIEERAATSGEERLALVLDIDDTSLSSYPYLARTAFGDRRNRESLPAIAPVRELAVRAAELGIALFFVSERSTARIEETARNLAEVGFPPAREYLFRPAEPPYPPFLLDPACAPAVFKAAARGHIEAQGFRVIASVGDQESDLEGAHRERGFKLPNPLYRVP
jgi:predicted secreted acid phosphatase